MYFPVVKLDRQTKQGLGWWWTSTWYTIWNGKSWLPMRKMDDGSALDWFLDSKERFWGQSVQQYKHVDGRWVRAR
jgi:hypothetical protein